MLQSIPDLVQEIRANLRCVTAEQAVQEMAVNKGVLVDVREAAEVAARPALLSVPIPRGVLEMKITQQVTDSSQQIYVHCATGARATLAAEQLQRIGYKHVAVITCGIDEVCKQR